VYTRKISSVFIYFVEAEGLDAIKIGATIGRRGHEFPYEATVAERIKNLQVSVPVNLNLIGFLKGYSWQEFYLHQTFAEHRIRGEWFRFSPIRLRLEELLSGKEIMPLTKPPRSPRLSDRFASEANLGNGPGQRLRAYQADLEAKTMAMAVRKQRGPERKPKQPPPPGEGISRALAETRNRNKQRRGEGMGKTIYRLGGQEYTTKKAVKDRCSTLLRTATISSEDGAFLLDLLALHPESEQKIGCGVARFYVGKDAYGGPCLWLSRLDGTATDWGTGKCLDPPTHRKKVHAALRWLVSNQILRFRDVEIGRTQACAITGDPITAATCHVDHIPPNTFIFLIDLFLQSEKLGYDGILIKPTVDGSTFAELENQELAARWQLFHRENAKLRLTTSHANMSQGSGKS
jgi:hypothetical protein